MGSKLFLQEKPVETLLTLRRGGASYTAEISRGINSTYAHTLKVVSNLKKLGLVGFERKGRVKIVKPSELGLTAARVFEEAIALLEVAGAGAAVENLYEREVKGLLRSEIDQKRVLNRLGGLRKGLERWVDEEREEIRTHTGKCLKRIEEIEREVTGLIVG